jgi:hypothetical protein
MLLPNTVVQEETPPQVVVIFDDSILSDIQLWILDSFDIVDASIELSIFLMCSGVRFMPTRRTT